MTVAELIGFLKTQPQDLTVAYYLFSEQCELDPTCIKIVELGPMRHDGWIANKRPDKQTFKYLMFPGN